MRNRANERRSGTSRNRTGDTRIFSPMLHCVKFAILSFAGAKVRLFFEPTKYLGNFFRKKLESELNGSRCSADSTPVP